jgi:phosphate transport system ATP-binding protein
LVTLDGQDVYARGVNVTALRRAVGMVFQQPNPFPMSIYDNIALAVREHERRIPRAELDGVVEHALRQASLWDEVRDCLTQSALSLSGGQQQRLCIARALAVKPTVLMLDEPCASLDPISTGRIEELLLELSADYTIVIVTHNLAQAQRISDKVGFFLMGRLVEFGDALQVFEASARPETAEYVRGAFG